MAAILGLAYKLWTGTAPASSSMARFLDLNRRHPAVLRVAGHRTSGLLVQLLQLVDVITRDGISFSLGIDAVHTRRVEAENLAFHLRGERFIAKLLYERAGHFEPSQSFDLPLR